MRKDGKDSTFLIVSWRRFRGRKTRRSVLEVERSRIGDPAFFVREEDIVKLRVVGEFGTREEALLEAESLGFLTEPLPPFGEIGKRKGFMSLAEFTSWIGRRIVG